MQECVRIEEPMLGKTEDLLGQILQPLLMEDKRVRFLCEPSQGRDVVQRIRVMLSRKRKILEARGKKQRKFRLHSSIHPETHNGVRKDCIVLWKSVNDLHVMSQDLEDLLSNG